MSYWLTVADERLEGCQHFAFKEYKNAKEDCILSRHANGSVSFQITQARVGPGKVPISIVYRHHFPQALDSHQTNLL
jgi:hypothetical protein